MSLSGRLLDCPYRLWLVAWRGDEALCSWTTQPREETSGKGRASALCPQPRLWPCPASCIPQPRVPLVIHLVGWCPGPVCSQRRQQNLWDQRQSRWTGCPQWAALGVCPCVRLEFHTQGNPQRAKEKQSQVLKRRCKAQLPPEVLLPRE